MTVLQGILVLIFSAVLLHPAPDDVLECVFYSVLLRRRLLGLAMLVTLPSFASAQQSAPMETTEAQKRMVAELSGWSSAAGQSVPFSRSTPEERAVAASYLIDSLAEVGLAGQVHEYRLPNINGLVDLLLPPYRGANVS